MWTLSTFSFELLKNVIPIILFEALNIFVLIILIKILLYNVVIFIWFISL